MKKFVKTFIWVLLLPLLFLPYSILNSEVLVEKFGCGCKEGFNANDFTAYFVLFVSLVTLTLITVFFAKEYGFRPKKRILLFIIGIILSALLIGFFAKNFIGYQMWN